MSSWSIVDKVVLVTGGNTGIGKAAALELARRGAHVLFTSRDEEKGQAAQRELAEQSGKSVGWVLLDLASFESIRRCADEVLERCPALHVLINNAGLIQGERRVTKQGFEMTLGVNHVGHALLTKLLLQRLIESTPARIINVASASHRRAITGLNFDDLQSEKRYFGLLAYSRSKLANIYYTTELARHLEGKGVTVNAVHPGVVSTEFALNDDTKGVVGLFYKLAKPVLLSPEGGARTIIYCAIAPELEGVTGKYFSRSKQSRPSSVARNQTHATELWDLTQQWIEQGHP